MYPGHNEAKQYNSLRMWNRKSLTVARHGTKGMATSLAQACTLHWDVCQPQQSHAAVARGTTVHQQPPIQVSNCQPATALLCHWSVPLKAPFPSQLNIKGPWILTEKRWFSERLVCHLLNLLAFQLKSSFLAPTTHLPIYWPVMQWAGRPWAQ